MFLFGCGKVRSKTAEWKYIKIPDCTWINSIRCPHTSWDHCLFIRSLNFPWIDNSCCHFSDVCFCPSTSHPLSFLWIWPPPSLFHLHLSLFLSLHPAATVTSSSENEERCGSSLEWAKDGGAGLRGENGRGHQPPCTPITQEKPAVCSDAQPRSSGGSAPIVTSPADGPVTYHSTSLVMPRPNSVAGE